MHVTKHINLIPITKEMTHLSRWLCLLTTVNYTVNILPSETYLRYKFWSHNSRAKTFKFHVDKIHYVFDHQYVKGMCFLIATCRLLERKPSIRFTVQHITLSHRL
jgi:hypothetical protein